MATVDTVKGRYSSYKLLNEVGRGGCAVVYHAQDLATRKDVAVKQLFGKRPQDMEDWLREVDALNTLNSHHCPHVVKYLDHMQQHDRLFLVEEFTEHGSLLRCLKKKGKLSEDVVCRYIHQVLTALYHMAPWGVVHGDLKASNILLFDGDVVKLTDFALRSRSENGHEDAERRVTAASTPSADTPPPIRGSHAGRGTGEECAGLALLEFRGSPYWAAPEVLAGSSKATTASDIWSLGCLAVELLTGSPPYFERPVHNAIHHILKKYYEVLCESDTIGGGAGGTSRTPPSPATPSAATGSGDDDGPRGPRKKKNAVSAMRATATTSTDNLPKEPVDVARATVSSGTDSALDRNEVGTPLCEAALLPPLPGDLHVSDECASFLRLCFRPRAVDRRSAGELLHEPWFLDCTVPQLLRAAREGRPMNGTTSDEGVSSGSRFAMIEQWVKRNLTCAQESRCKAWLNSDALPLLVPVLTPRIMTPKYIGDVMCVFAQFAESRSALAMLFVNRLGSTDLWGVEELTSACDADHLATLFQRCCATQDAQVPLYTPTDPRALRFVLGLEKEKALACVRALHSRLVLEPKATGSLATVTDGNAVDLNNGSASSREPTAPAHVASDCTPASLQEQHEQQRRARERLLNDGGAAALCQCVEAQCKAAFLSNTAPMMEWSTMNLLFDVLSTIEPLAGGKALLWGFGADISGGHVSPSSTVGTGSGGAAVAKSLPVATNPFGGRGGGELNSTWEKSASGTGAPLLSSTLGSQQESLYTTVAAVGVSGGLLSSLGSTMGFGGYTISGPPPESVQWATSMSWLLAVQEASRHLCEAAVRLLTRYVPLARRCRAEYLEKAGVSLTATLVLVASSERVSTELRCAAVESLPQLQASSLRAARYLRDPVRCIALLALTLKRTYGVPALTSCILTAITAMTAEKQMLAACTGCPCVWEALVSLLREVEAADHAVAADGKLSRSHSHSATGTDSQAVEGADASPALTAAVASPTSAQSPSASSSNDSGTSSAAATFADIIVLLSRWFTEVTPTSLLNNAVTTAATASEAMHALCHPAAPPPLPVLLQTLRRQLIALSQNGRVCHDDLMPDVAKALRHLAPLEAAAVAASTPTATVA
ncbi:protein kinase, putative [Leishmania tarentolae]|uniref:Protein kinase, putative n=1 Tax=Leishmania tarentolae TaxID=5689 RepID=A0A640KFN2_LEITA|nr:protein kinase, putative [Leishmania tarentolae]